MNRNRNTKTKTKKRETDEVDELLQAAQDDMLLSLSVDSYISRLSVVDADVDRRFQALKLKTGAEAGAASKSSSNSNSNSIQVEEELKAVLGDDLSTRFAALKAASSSSSAIIAASASLHDAVADDEDDEVEKLIRWAKDAARLDPSPPSDDDDSSFVNDMTDGRRHRKGNWRNAWQIVGA